MPKLSVVPFKLGTRDVVHRFLQKDAKNVATAPAGLYDAIRILELTTEYDLLRAGKLASVRGKVREFRHELRDHSLRLFVAYVPTGHDVVVLHIVVKKQNRLDPGDIDIAERNLRIYLNRQRNRK